MTKGTGKRLANIIVEQIGPDPSTQVDSNGTLSLDTIARVIPNATAQEVNQAVESLKARFPAYRVVLPKTPSEEAELQWETELKLLSLPETGQAAKWIVDAVEERMEQVIESAVDDLLREIIDAAVYETRAVEREIRTEWDVSYEGVDTDQPYDLSVYDTVGDFLEEILPGNKPTFESGHGLTTCDRREEVNRRAIELLDKYLTVETKRLMTQAPAPLDRHMQELHKSGMLSDLVSDVYEEIVDRGIADELELMLKIELTPFREALLRFSPESKARLERDIAHAKARQQRAEEASQRAKSVLEQLQSQYNLDARKIDNKETAKALLTDIVALAVDALGLETVRYILTKSPLPRLWFTHSLKQWFLKEGKQWLFQVGDAPKFHTPLVLLFQALNQARKEENRHYLVTLYGEPSASFGADNWAYFLAYALSGEAGQSTGVTIRRFEVLRDLQSGLPWKSVACVYIEDEQITPLSQYEAREMYTTHPDTGELLEEEMLVRYLDAVEMVPGLFANEN